MGKDAGDVLIQSLFEFGRECSLAGRFILKMFSTYLDGPS